MMKTKIWKWVVFKGIKYKGKYRVSSIGEIKSVARIANHKNAYRIPTRFLKVSQNDEIYPTVTLCGMNGRVDAPVHLVVLETFVGPCPEGMQCRHLNDIRSDNRWPENLCWGTPSENQQDAVKNGKYSKVGKHKNHAKGSRQHLAKLSDEKVKKIRKAWSENNGRGMIAFLAKKYKVAEATMWSIVNNKTWLHIT